MRVQELDIDKVTFNQNGIAQHRLPFDIKDLNNCYLDYLKNISQSVKVSANHKHIGYEILQIIYYEFITMSFRYYYHSLFANFAKREKIKFNIPADFHLLALFFDNKKADCQHYFQYKTPQPSPAYKKAARIFRDIMVQRHENIKRINFQTKPNILSITQQEEAEFFAQSKTQQVFFKRHRDLFANHYETQAHQLPPAAVLLIDIANNLYIAMDDSIRSTAQAYNFQLMQSLYNNTCTIYENLSLTNLCEEMWFTTSHEIWHRTLAKAAQDANIKVVHFDHACGTGMLDQSTGTSNYKFDNGDSFVTYSNKYIEKYLTADTLTPQKNKTFIKLENGFFKKALTPAHTSPKLDVLYASTLSPSQLFYHSLLPDITYIDWQFKLFQFLKKNKYNFNYKLHPEQKHSQALTKTFPQTLGNARFETVFQNYKVILVDHIMSSIFKSLVQSTAGIVFVDFGLIDIDTEARSLLEQRVEIVSGSFSEDGRAEVDFSQLFHAMSSCKDKRHNKKFINRFFYDVIDEV